MKKIIYSILILSTLACSSMAQASDAAHELPAKAPILFTIPLPGGFELPFSNSMVMLFCSVVLIAIAVRLMTWNMRLIPGRFQNFIEAVFEALYGFVESLLGARMTKRYFWFFGTAFIIILVNNYMGLIPGVGIFTVTNQAGEVVPLFRGANADMNVTVAMSFLFAVLWIFWSIREQGFKHFILHIFGPKGGMKGWLGISLIPIFLFVGVIECVSILIRPVALSARLYGNIFGGESVIEKMSMISDHVWMNAVFVFLFLAMELLIGFIQAFVFLLLTVLFLKTQVGDETDAHDEEEETSVSEQPALTSASS